MANKRTRKAISGGVKAPKPARRPLSSSKGRANAATRGKGKKKGLRRQGY